MAQVMQALRENDLLKYFDYVITNEDALKLKADFSPKPAPDIFLLAATAIKVEPSACRGPSVLE